MSLILLMQPRTQAKTFHRCGHVGVRQSKKDGRLWIFIQSFEYHTSIREKRTRKTPNDRKPERRKGRPSFVGIEKYFIRCLKSFWIRNAERQGTEVEKAAAPLAFH